MTWKVNLTRLRTLLSYSRKGRLLQDSESNNNATYLEIIILLEYFPIPISRG